MDKEYLIKRFDELLEYFPQNLKIVLEVLEPEIKLAAQEIRLRAGRPLTITISGSQFFVGAIGTSMIPKADSIYVTARDIENCFLKLCNRSVYSHNDELKEGFIILRGGHRAGVCGTVTMRDGHIETMRDISSINLRIAKEVPNCASEVIKEFDGGGILVCGGPGSGKTTLIRDMARQLANGVSGKCLKVAIIDSRGEIAAVSNGIPMADLGNTTDIITACPKGKGIEMALRTLYPDVIVFDEIGDVEEVKAVEQSLNSGVSVITSAHIGNLSDLYKRKQICRLLGSGAVEKVVMCNSKNGFSYSLYEEKELRKTYLKQVTI